MRHTLSNGTRIRVERGQIHGLYEADLRLITLDTGLRGRLLVETLLHEVLHAECPKLPEAVVERAARSQAKALWTLLRRSKRD